MQATVIANTLTSPPIDFPTVKIGGESYELRFTLASSFFLETQADIPAQELTNWINEQVQKNRIQTMIMTIAGAMLGVPSGDEWEPMPMAAKDIARKASGDEWAFVMKAYTEAMQKAAAAMTAALDKLKVPAAPPQETEPIPEVVN